MPPKGTSAIPGGLSVSIRRPRQSDIGDRSNRIRHRRPDLLVRRPSAGAAAESHGRHRTETVTRRDQSIEVGLRPAVTGDAIQTERVPVSLQVLDGRQAYHSASLFETGRSTPDALHHCRPRPGGRCRPAMTRDGNWWSGGGSNSRPSHCERDALPAELPPHTGRIF